MFRPHDLQRPPFLVYTPSRYQDIREASKPISILAVWVLLSKKGLQRNNISRVCTVCTNEHHEGQLHPNSSPFQNVTIQARNYPQEFVNKTVALVSYDNSQKYLQQSRPERTKMWPPIFK